MGRPLPASTVSSPEPIVGAGSRAPGVCRLGVGAIELELHDL
jgi:hypothetical protein